MKQLTEEERAFLKHIHTWKHNGAVNEDTVRQTKMIAPQKAIDFGAGDGFYGKLVKYLFPECYIIGVEMETSYVGKFGLNGVYDLMVVGDLVKLLDKLGSSDLVIFGDVLEHLEEAEAKEVIKKAVDLFPYVLINSPIGFQPNDDDTTRKIPSELHRCGIERSTFDDYTVLEWNIYCEGEMFNCLLRGRGE